MLQEMHAILKTVYHQTGKKYPWPPQKKLVVYPEWIANNTLASLASSPQDATLLIDLESHNS